MTATVAPMVAVPGGSDEPADRAAPLDALLVRATLLVQATQTPLRRFVPACPLLTSSRGS